MIAPSSIVLRGELTVLANSKPSPSPHFSKLAFSFRNAGVVSALRKDPDSGASTVTESRLGNAKGNSVYQLLEDSTEAEIAESGGAGQTFYGTSAEERYVQATRDQGMINRCELAHDALEKDRDRDACNEHKSNGVSKINVGESGGNKSVMERQAVQDEDKGNGVLFGPDGLLSSSTIWLILVLVALVQVKRTRKQSPTGGDFCSS